LVLSCGISEDLEDPEELRMELAGLASLPPYALKWRVSKRVSDYLSAILSSEVAATVRLLTLRDMISQAVPTQTLRG
jgi:hypothetical protein